MARPSQPPFKNPRLRVVWAAIAALQPDEALELALFLHQQLGRGSFPSTRNKDRVADALACLRQVAERLGKSPSVREYEDERSKFPELELIASGSIRTRLTGGWNDCLKRAQLETIPDGDLPVVKRTDFTDEEIVAALRECKRDLGAIPTGFTYREWAQRPDILARPGNRPETYAPMIRAFGGFDCALRAAGIVGDAIVRGDRVSPTNRSYQEAELVNALRVVHDRLGYSPSAKEYSSERQLILAEQLASGTLTSPMPAASTIAGHFKFWGDALEAAGLPPRRNRRNAESGPKGPRYNDARVLASIRSAYAAAGEPFTAAAYDSWRLQLLAVDPTQSIPAAATAATRFGSWAKAVERAFAASGDQAPDAKAA